MPAAPISSTTRTAPRERPRASQTESLKKVRSSSAGFAAAFAHFQSESSTDEPRGNDEVATSRPLELKRGSTAPPPQPSAPPTSIPARAAVSVHSAAATTAYQYATATPSSETKLVPGNPDAAPASTGGGLCGMCEEDTAVLSCSDCRKMFCGDCDRQSHLKGASKKHVRTPLRTPSTTAASMPEALPASAASAAPKRRGSITFRQEFGSSNTDDADPNIVYAQVVLSSTAAKQNGGGGSTGSTNNGAESPYSSMSHVLAANDAAESPYSSMAHVVSGDGGEHSKANGSSVALPGPVVSAAAAAPPASYDSKPPPLKRRSSIEYFLQLARGNESDDAGGDSSDSDISDDDDYIDHDPESHHRSRASIIAIDEAEADAREAVAESRVEQSRGATVPSAVTRASTARPSLAKHSSSVKAGAGTAALASIFRGSGATANQAQSSPGPPVPRAGAKPTHRRGRGGGRGGRRGGGRARPGGRRGGGGGGGGGQVGTHGGIAL